MIYRRRSDGVARNGPRTETAAVAADGMGCTASTAPEDPVLTTTPVNGVPAAGPFEQHPPLLLAKGVETVAQAYRRLDEQICVLESTCPGPRLVTAEAWLEHLKADPAMVKDQGTEATPLERKLSEVPNGIQEDQRSEDDESEQDKIRTDVTKLVTTLGIAFDEQKAATQEEFFARISRSAMDLESAAYRKDMVDHAQQRVRQLHREFEQLRVLYVEQDYLLSGASGGTYSSLYEQKLDNELEATRDVRDRLGGATEQWRTSGALLRAAAKAMHQTVEYWALVGPSKDATERVSLALDCRSASHGALIALEAAQAALPHVDIPYITVRQQTAVRHGLVYLLTDMVNPARYRHTRDVFDVFCTNVGKAVTWLHDCYRDSLRKDFDEANQTVMMAAKELREERLRLISQKYPDKIYVRPAIG